MSLAYVGPIAVSFHGDPTFSFSASPSARGLQPCSIGGYLEWSQGEQLQELVGNGGRLVTIGDASGVLEPIWPDDSLLATFRGWYLLGSCELTPDVGDSVPDAPVPFSLAATLLPEGLAAVLTRSARARPNDFALVPRATAVQRFHNGSFVRSPGGLRFTRQFDPLPHDAARQLAPAADMEIYVGGVGELALAVGVSVGGP